MSALELARSRNFLKALASFTVGVSQEVSRCVHSQAITEPFKSKLALAVRQLAYSV
jgi:hypothetical protein